MTMPLTDSPWASGPPPVAQANGHRPRIQLPDWASRGAIDEPTDTVPARPTDRSAQEPTVAPTAPATDNTTGTTDSDRPAKTSKLTTADKWVLSGVAVALGAVILAPIGLSSQDLYDWATAPRGLNLSGVWPYLVPVALDLAAASCIGMTIVAAWRRDRPGVFSILVWAFAATSAYAQGKHGLAEQAAGRAQDAWWAMPTFALLGPLLLEVTLNRIRRWARLDHGEQHNGAAGFGSRWLPGVAFRETLSAWAASRREGIDKAADAVQFVRDRQALSVLSAVEAVHYAVAALQSAKQSTDDRSVRVWLSARGATVAQSDIDRAAGRPTSGQSPRPTVPAVADEPNGPAVAREAVAGPAPVAPVRPAVPAVAADRPARPIAPTRQPQPAKPRPVAPKTDRQATAAVDGHSAAAVANAAELRKRYPDGLTDSDYQIRQATGWSYDRLQKAKAAYKASADRQADSSKGSNT